MITAVHLVKLPSVDFRRTSLMISQHWFRYLLGAFRHQAIICVNVYPDPHRQMASLGHIYMLFPQNMHMVIDLLYLPWDVTGMKYIKLSATNSINMKLVLQNIWCCGFPPLHKWQTTPICNHHRMAVRLQNHIVASYSHFIVNDSCSH